MISEILHREQNHTARIAYLKSHSDYWPEVFFKKDQIEIGVEVFASTLLRIERGGIWYAVHHVDSMLQTEEQLNIDGLLMQRLARAVYVTQHFYQISKEEYRDAWGRPIAMQDVDKIQLSEKERLIERYPHLK